jgi:hypothetical protein
MNASVREPDQGSSKDEPLRYAPKKTRQPEPDSAPAAGPAPLKGDAALEQPLDAAADPPWRRSRPRNGSGATFAGDVAIAELRTKLALAPDRLPEPPPPSTGGSKLAWTGRIMGVAVVVAVGFLGYRWGSTSRPLPPSQTAAPTAPVDRGFETGPVINNPTPTVYSPSGRPITSPQGPARQVTVGDGPVQLTDEVARLAITASDAGANAAVVITGLSPGATMSTGREMAGTWRLSIDDLPGAAVIPPRGFIGTMDLIVELRLADNGVADRKGVRVEWLARPTTVAKAAPRQHDAAEIAQMMTKGTEYMANGDVSGARLMFQRAAEAGETTGAAAFAVAETFDPLALAKGILPDVAQARTWYARAKDLGAPQAGERLERLVRSPDQ